MQRAALFSGGDAQMAAGDLGELLVPYMPTIRVPKSGDRVYKTECAFSYDSPVSAAKPPSPTASAPPLPAADLPSAGALRQTRPSCGPFPAASPAPRAAPSPGPLPPPQPSKSSLSPSFATPPASTCPRSQVSPLALPARAAPSAAAGAPQGEPVQRCAFVRSFVRALAPSFVYFFPSGDVKWLLRRGDFAVRGKLSCLLENGLWRSEVCPLPPLSGSPCFYCHTEAVTRGSRRPSRLCVLASRCQSFCLPAASVLILFLKIFSESFQSGGST